MPDIYDRVVAVLSGEKPERLPFIDRLELWYTSHARAGTLPEAFMRSSASPMVHSVTISLPEDFRGMPLSDVHRAVGMGQQMFERAYAHRLRGTELRVTLDGELFYHEIDPVVEYFPRLYDILPPGIPGSTVAELITPVGTLTMRSQLVPHMYESGTLPFMQEHPIKDAADYRVLEYVAKRAEYVPKHEKIYAKQVGIGEIGFVVPVLTRVPFQSLLLDFVGEIPLFYMLHDDRGLVERMMTLLDNWLMEDIRQLTDLAWPYVEFVDNVDGVMTNPKLFEQYSLPYYQKYVDHLHQQGKKVGSHTDGNLKPILELLAESGLDVCESFSPAPLTACTFDEAWAAWKDKGPMIWGGIPSPVLEARTPEADFRAFVRHVLETVEDQPIILGVGDMVLGDNLIERVQYIAEQVEKHRSSSSRMDTDKHG